MDCLERITDLTSGDIETMRTKTVTLMKGLS